MPTVPNDRCQKSWTSCIQRRWKRLYQRIIVQLTNLGHVLLPKFAKHTLSGPNSPTQFLCHGVSFATLSKSSSFVTECHGLHFGEELWRLILQSYPPEALSLAELEPKRNEVSSIKKVLVSITASLNMPVYIRLKQGSRGAFLYVTT